LLNYAMPFIRYAPGDGGSLLQTHCSCGRGLQRLGSLEGRVRDIVIAPDGRRVHGAFFNHFEPFYRTTWIEGFQVHQRRAGAMTLRLQTTRRPDKDELAPILAELRRGLGEGMRIDVEFVEEIPRSKAGKHRLIVSELDP
jgi:phenylacetate-CoA ligase